MLHGIARCLRSDKTTKNYCCKTTGVLCYGFSLQNSHPKYPNWILGYFLTCSSLQVAFLYVWGSFSHIWKKSLICCILLHFLHLVKNVNFRPLKVTRLLVVTNKILFQCFIDYLLWVWRWLNAWLMFIASEHCELSWRSWL